jgi:uncharacterized heparinase superfamily protein
LSIIDKLFLNNSKKLALSQLKLLYNIAKISPAIAMKKAFAVLARKSKKKKQRAEDTSNSTFVSFKETNALELKTFGYDFELSTDKNLMELADRFCRHQFNLLGSDWICLNRGLQAKGIENVKYDTGEKFSNIIEIIAKSINENNREEAHRIAHMIRGDYLPIDWQIDFRSGFRWKASSWYKDIRFADDKGHDIKMPWELGRMQYLPLLALAAINDKVNSDKYINEIRNQIIDFIALNPPKYGVQWNSSMDIAIRAINWLVTYDILLSNDIKFDDEFLMEFNRSLIQHARHIRKNLEWSDGLRGNHYLSNLCGLIYITSYLEGDQVLEEYFEFALKEFKNEIKYQFNEDGGNFEASTNYHFLSMEMVLLTIRIIEKKLKKSSKEIFDAEIIDKISKMKKYASHLIKSNNTISQIGDNDSGMILKLHSDEYMDVGNKLHLLRRFAIERNEDDEYCVSLPSTGVYILKKKNYRMDISCGGIGLNGKGGHAHNDLHSFTLSVKGKEFVVDPGSYVYTSFHRLRNYYRSTAVHNTMIINGLEQRDFIGNELSWLKNETNFAVEKFDKKSFSAWHNGYNEKHTRVLEFGDSNIIATDECRLSNEKILRFHLAPEVQANITENGIELVRDDTKLLLTFEQGRANIENYNYSPQYGVKIESQLVEIRSTEDKINWRIEIVC